MEFERKLLESELDKKKQSAEKIAGDKEKVEDLLEKTRERAQHHKGPLESVWDDLQAVFGMIGDSVTGAYPHTPFGTLVAVLGALLYFLSPLDLLADFFPFLGYFDDAALIGLVFSQFGSDIKNYKEWKAGQAKKDN